MILDSGAEIYVWIGSGAQPEEKAQGLEIAKVKSPAFERTKLQKLISTLLILQGYLRTDPTQRNEDNTLIFTVNEGNEPASFTTLFQA